MDCEVLVPEKISRRAIAILGALIDTAEDAGVKCIVNDRPRAGVKALMSWGLGHPVRRLWTDAHLKSGGRVIGWDLGYWDRENAMRVTVDHGHPQRVMRDMPGDRWARAGIELRDVADPAGPVMLVGMGVKSRQQFAMVDREWERRMLGAIQHSYPGRRVIYRAKRLEVSLPGCEASGGSIEDALQGVSLVVCRHSNVAVDACIAGVPVVCEDGAAAALYGSDLKHPVIPDAAARLRFLQNLAWWQWKPGEAAQAWQFLRKVCA